MKLNRTVIVATAVTCLAGLASGEILTRVALLRGDAEVPANASTAKGWAAFRIDTDTNTVSYRIAFNGLTGAETAAHIHGFVNPGVNGGVVVPLPAGNPKVGTFTYAEADEAKYLNGQAYVNIHSAGFGGGEIRGQIVSAVAELTGDQEVPANASPARGFALFNMDYCRNEMQYYIAYSGLTAAEVAAHIHGRALPGVNAGILEPLPAGMPKVGTWAYDPNLEQSIADGLTYVNIHTAAFGGGEIRGQIVSMVNPVDRLQEVPSNASTAAGGVLISLERSTNTVGFGITLSGLVAQTAAHFHGYSTPGVNSGVKFNIGAGTPKRGTWVVPAVDFPSVLGELSYFNAHTAAFGGGEIRGQLNMSKIFYCPADWNKDDVVDLTDFFGFLNDFDITAPGADIDCDGTTDLTDFFGFLNGFDVGC